MASRKTYVATFDGGILILQSAQTTDDEADTLAVAGSLATPEAWADARESFGCDAQELADHMVALLDPAGRTRGARGRRT